MDKKIERYFGRNLISKLYVVSIVLIGAAVLIATLYRIYVGLPIALAGIVLFFVSAVFRVSDKDIDEKVDSALKNYGEECIKGKHIGKRELSGDEFVYFTGYLCDKPNVRFKSGSDGKLRTSRFFVTAVSVTRGECIVCASVYDLLGASPREDTFIYLTAESDNSLTRTELEFPRGVVKYTAADGQAFCLPDDAQADDLISKISRI